MVRLLLTFALWVPVLEASAIYELPAPEYPEKCLKAGIEGTVILQLTFSRDGKINEIAVIESPSACPQFAVEAKKAVLRAKFHALPEGERLIEKTLRLPVRFSIDPNA